MSAELTIAVAGVRFRAVGDRPFDVEGVFSRFTQEGPAEVEVHARAGRLPSDRGERAVWDSGRGWGVYRRGKDLVIRVRATGKGHPPAMCVRLPAVGPAEAVLDQDGPVLYNVLSVPLGPVLAIGALSARGGALLHGCGARVGRAGLAFPAPSGGGKTTLAGRLQRLPGVVVLGDDTLAILPRGDRWLLAGTPWSGHPEHAAAEAAVLHGIGFLRKGRPPSSLLLSQAETARRTLGRLFVAWWLPQGAMTALEVARSIGERVEGRLVTLTPTLRAAESAVRTFAPRESRPRALSPPS